MNANCERLLSELARCPEGKGLVLRPPSQIKGYAYCMKQGWLTRLGVPGLMVTAITNDGRKALANNSKEVGNGTNT